MEIGTYLRETREEKGISLDSLQEKTKIQKRYLQAIEDGNFHLLPGKFYAKAFIKEYANAVDIDSTELIEAYDQTSVETQEEEASEYTRVKQTPMDTSSTKDSTSILPKFMVILLVIGILFAAIYFYKKGTDSETTDPVDQDNDQTIIRNSEPEVPQVDEEEKEEDEDEEENEKEENKKEDKEDKDEEKADKPTFKVVTEGTGSTPESVVELTGVKDKVSVELVIKDDEESASWVEVKDADGKSYARQEINPNEEVLKFEVDVPNEVSFVVGDASVLEIKINDEVFKYPVDPKTKVFQKIKLEISE